MNLKEILDHMNSCANPDTRTGMARFGVPTTNALGISIPTLRRLAKQIGRDHQLALSLWETGIHEARILAGMIDVPDQVTESQMESWAADFDSWDVCDQVCNNLFRKTGFAYKKSLEWCTREEEYVKRAGFALAACLAVGDKKSGDVFFEQFFPHIVKQAVDDRNFVKKAVNWALRQIGKRNKRLHQMALETAHALRENTSPSARWIARDAIRELESQKIIARIV